MSHKAEICMHPGSTWYAKAPIFETDTEATEYAEDQADAARAVIDYRTFTVGESVTHKYVNHTLIKV